MVRDILHEVVPYRPAYYLDFFTTERRLSSSSKLCQGEANRFSTMDACGVREVKDRTSAFYTLSMAVGRRSQTCDPHLTTSLHFTLAASVSASTSAKMGTREAPTSRLHPRPARHR